MSGVEPDTIGAAAVAAREQGEGGIQPDEFAMMMAQAHYLYIDDKVIAMIEADDRLKPLLPALSHLIRTSKLTDDKSIMIMKLRWRRALRLKLMVLSGKSDVASMAEFDALLNFGYSVIEDQRGGWRGRLVTERIRSYKIETPEKKRKKFLGIF